MYSLKRNETVFFVIADTSLLCITLMLSIYFNGESYFNMPVLFLGISLIAFWLLIVYLRKLYFTNLFGDIRPRLFNFLKSSFILIFLIGVAYLFFTFPSNFGRSIVAFSIAFPLAGLVTNSIAISVINRARKSSNSTKKVLLVDQNEENGNNYSFIHLNPGYKAVDLEKFSLLGSIETELGEIVADAKYMKGYLNDNHVDEIVLSFPVKVPKGIRDICEIADHHGTRVKIVPDYRSLIQNDYRSIYKPIAFNTRPMPLDDKKLNFLKQTFDWIFSGIVLVLLSPIFVIIAVLIKLESPRPIFYCPIRVGKSGKPFKLYKFSTMRDSDPEDGGTKSTQKDDPRITRLGIILRKYSLDELPQFLNVFLGDMSVVGPRPHRSYLNQQFQASERRYMVRHYYKPGITGWAQVNGWRGPTGSIEQKQQRTVHDLWYLENWSFKLDIRIIFMTLFGKKTHKYTF